MSVLTIENIINVNVVPGPGRNSALVEWTSGKPGAYGYLFYTQGNPTDPSLTWTQVTSESLGQTQNTFKVGVTGLDPHLPYSFFVETVLDDRTTIVAMMTAPQYLLNPLLPSGVVPISGGYPLAGPMSLGRDRAVNLNQGTIPNLFDGFDDWLQNMTFEKVGKLTSNATAFQVLETTVQVPFRGLIVPEKSWELQFKPVGQRVWKFYKVYAETSLPLFVDDVILWQGTQYRVTSLTDWSLYGHFEYEIAQDWTVKGPLR